MSNRYSRQILVNQIGLAGQEQLANAKVLIIGLGGLGCQIGIQLAGAGVGSLVLFDHDVIDISNLHRQALFREADIGAPKATIAKRELEALNSEISIVAFNNRASVDNINSLLESVDLVVDAADNFPTSYLLSDACLQHNVPLVSASVNRSFGYVGVFCAAHGKSKQKNIPSFRALFPRLPKEQLSCDTVGVSGPSVGIIANIQAQEALKILINDPQALYGKILYADVWQYKLHCIDFSKAQEPEESRISIITEMYLDENDFILDVRNAEEIKATPQPFSVAAAIPMPELSDRLAEIPQTKRVVCVCASGQRALIAAQQLSDHGIIEVAALLPSS